MIARGCACLRVRIPPRPTTPTFAGHQVAASMPLQMTLYFSVPYALVWAALNQFLFYWKSQVRGGGGAIAVPPPQITLTG